MLSLIILIVFANFIFEFILEYLNINNWSKDIPENLRDIYPVEKYEMSRKYALANYRFSKITSLFSFFILLLALIFGIFGWLDEWIRQYTDSPILIAILFFGTLGFASDLISIPFSIYKTFVIEERFGFNKTTPKTFVLDKLKGYMLAIIFGSIILAALVKIFEITGDDFWWIAWIFLTSLTLFITVFYTSLLLPIFNKLTPLPEGELRTSIESYCRKNSFLLSDIFVMDGSKRSSKANAFFSGLGKRKKIVLYDTLIKEHSTDELVAVLAHETGHYKLKHTLTGFLAGIVQTGIMLFIFSLLQGNPALADALGASQSGFHLEILAFTLLYSPVSFISGMLMHLLSRKNEFEADAFAKDTFDGNALSKALKKLSSDNLSNPTPHPAFVFVHYSHPPLLQRLKALEKK